MNDVQYQDRIQLLIPLLICPACREDIEINGNQLYCPACGRRFPVSRGVPHFLYDEAQTLDQVTHKIQSFYDAHPFPDYEDCDDLASLLEKAREGVFARLLDEQLPYGTRILECGCGTGQLSNFLGIAHRTVIGTDLATNSLGLAEAFRRKHGLERVFFLQMNLFEPVFRPESFDFVICNGVLHHTPDPRTGMDQLTRLLRPKGILIIGLYHRFGRLLTDFRRALLKISGFRLRFLDPRIRRANLGKARQSAWLADQYRNPHESKHTISEVLGWLRDSELDFVRSIPKTALFDKFSPEEKLFEAELPGRPAERWIKELGQAVTGDREGGFFTMILRKKH